MVRGKIYGKQMEEKGQRRKNEGKIRLEGKGG